MNEGLGFAIKTSGKEFSLLTGVESGEFLSPDFFTGSGFGSISSLNVFNEANGMNVVLVSTV